MVSQRHLDKLKVPRWVVDYASQLHLVLHSHLQVSVGAAIQLDPREQVTDQAQEQRLVLVHLEHRDRKSVV